MTQLEFYTLARSLFVPSETQAANFQKLMVARYHVNVSIDEESVSNNRSRSHFQQPQ